MRVANSWPFWARAVGRAWAMYERMGNAKEALLRRVQPGRGLLTSRLNPGGLLALYRESIGYRRLRPMIAAAMAAGRLEHREDYESLQILQVR